jgi:hypothetical protein
MSAYIRHLVTGDIGGTFTERHLYRYGVVQKTGVLLLAKMSGYFRDGKDVNLLDKFRVFAPEGRPIV